MPLVLVHSPLVGPLTWRSTADALRERGRTAIVPSLAEGFADGPPYYPALATSVAEQVDRHQAEQVLLAGHSGAGALLPAIAEATSTQVAGMIFVDALLPHPGQSWFDTAPEELTAQLRALADDGRLPPWSEWFPSGTLEQLLPDEQVLADFRADLPALPLSYFAERAPASTEPKPHRAAYLRLSDGYVEQARHARAHGWQVAHRDAHHVAMLTEPEVIAADLLDLARTLGPRSGISGRR